MNWKKWTAIAILTLFVAANFYLIFKKDSEITRTKYIDEWRTVQEQTLVLSKEKAGVVVPDEEEHIYFQRTAGDFGQFLVKEGDEVSFGTPLFEYSPQSLETTMDQFEAEIAKLETEQDALEDNIDNLEKIERDLSSKKDDEEENLNNETMAASIKTQIHEKEWQISRIEAEIEKYEDLVSISREGLNNLTIESTISGVVKNISHDLQNPVVTITSSEQRVEGLLEGEEILEIQEGMKAIIHGGFGKIEGSVSEVAVNPDEDPKVGVKSEYPFSVQFGGLEMEDEEVTEESEDEAVESEDTTTEVPEPVIFTGEQVDIKIITKEIENALTLPAKTIHNGNIYVLKGDGTLEKRPVETGIAVTDIQEITSEVEEGELVVYEPTTIRNKTAFFTPIDISKMKKKAFVDMGKKEMLKYFGRGFLSR